MLPAPGPFESGPRPKASPARALIAVGGAVVLAGAAAAALVWWPAKAPNSASAATTLGAPAGLLAAVPTAGLEPAPFREPGQPTAAVGTEPPPFRDPGQPAAAGTEPVPFREPGAPAAVPGTGPAPFREPVEPAAAVGTAPGVGIAGEYWRETEPPGRPRKMSLCPDGRYFEYSAKVGRWSSPGGNEGKLAIALDSGKTLELPFRILREPRFCSLAGCDAEFDGARYGRDPTLGNCQ
jgi:hypothetical protein